jgi:hypothetical protein
MELRKFFRKAPGVASNIAVLRSYQFVTAYTLGPLSQITLVISTHRSTGEFTEIIIEEFGKYYGPYIDTTGSPGQ